MARKIHPSVDALIKPIIATMTKIDIAQQSNPIVDPHNEPEYIKEAKKSCVHITFDGSDYKLRAAETDDGRLVCQVCGREIATKFDKSAVDTLMEATKVINQIVFFGMLNGLKAEPLATLISLKRALPAAAKLIAELNEYVKRDESSSDAVSNIGNEYNTPSFRSITNI